MDRKYWEEKEIQVYWWNFGKRTLDYKGTYKGFLEARGIAIEELKENHFRFQMSLSGGKVTLDTTGGYCHGADEAIRIFLTLLGDKATFSGPTGRYRINW